MKQRTLNEANRVIDEIISLIYKQGARAITKKIENGTVCKYVANVDGKTLYCAHSLALKKEYRKSAEGSAWTVINMYSDKVHLKKYQGFTADFWMKMQKLHDNDDCWEKKDKLSLSKRGEEYVKILKQRIEEYPTDFIR